MNGASHIHLILIYVRPIVLFLKWLWFEYDCIGIQIGDCNWIMIRHFTQKKSIYWVWVETQYILFKKIFLRIFKKVRNIQIQTFLGVNNFKRLLISIPKCIELNSESKPKLILVWVWAPGRDPNSIYTFFWGKSLIMIDCQWVPITSNDWTVIDYPVLPGTTG